MLTAEIRVPPNVKFEVDDIEKEWAYSSSFDFIHCRAMAAVIADWPRLTKQCFQLGLPLICMRNCLTFAIPRFTKPGGWVEFVDLDMRVYSSDGSLSDDSPLYKWNRDILRAARMMGREPNPGPLLSGFLHDAGFVSVKEEVYRVPIGTWPKDRNLVPAPLLHIRCQKSTIN